MVFGAAMRRAHFPSPSVERTRQIRKLDALFLPEYGARMEFDARAVARQVLRALRGKRTQSGMSRALGYGYNQYAKWEKGFKRVYWEDFTRICGLKRHPLSAWLEELYFLPEFGNTMSGHAFLGELLRAHFGGDARALAQALGAPLSTTRRWMSGETALPFEAALRGLACQPRSLGVLVSRLGCGAGTAAPKVSFDEIPFATAVQHFVGTREYRARRRHDARLLARKLRLSGDQAARAVERLVAAGHLVPGPDGYRSSGALEKHEGLSRSELKAMMRYWMYRALCSMESRASPPSPASVKNLRYFEIVAVSSRTAHEISNRFRDAILDALELVKKDKGPADGMRALVFHYFDAADCPHVDFEADRDLGLRLTGPKRASRTGRPAR